MNIHEHLCDCSWYSCMPLTYCMLLCCTAMLLYLLLAVQTYTAMLYKLAAMLYYAICCSYKLTAMLYTYLLLCCYTYCYMLYKLILLLYCAYYAVDMYMYMQI